jgi:RecT family
MSNEAASVIVAAQPVPFDVTPDLFTHFLRMADIMASATVSVPEHFRGKPGNCMAVIMQAHSWHMNPYAVAQKTHVTKSGLLGYEGQLVAAVVQSLAPIRNRPQYEFLGDWSKVLGNIRKETGKGGGDYYVQNWAPEDEEGCGLIVRATFLDETAPREVTIMMSQAWPRFSTQWATDPQQQICYLGIRKWARRHTPDVLLGVYTPEELRAGEYERDMGTVDEVEPGTRAGAQAARGGRTGPASSAASATSASPAASRTESVKASMRRNAPPPTLPEVLKAIDEAGDGPSLTRAGQLATRLIDDGEKETARRAYADKLAAGKAAGKTPTSASPAAAAASADKPQPLSFAEVADRLHDAAERQDRDGFLSSADLIRSVADEGQRHELQQLYTDLAPRFDDL